MAQLNVHAMTGTRAAQTIYVIDCIANHQIQVLVDGGSTLNFIQTHVAHSLGLHHIPSPLVKVLVGSGEELTCT